MIPLSLSAMLRKSKIILFVMALLTLTACSDDDFNDLPREIQTFINTYYPGESVSDFYESSTGISVYLKNSATLRFDADNRWTGIDGNGNVLPQMFMYDHFPQALYDYLVTTSTLNQVYSVTRNSGDYTVTLHNQIITYSAASGEVKPYVP